MKFLKDKIILITGGTGSFVNMVLTNLVKNSKIKKIIIFSRDESGQIFEKENSYMIYPEHFIKKKKYGKKVKTNFLYSSNLTEFLSKEKILKLI